MKNWTTRRARGAGFTGAGAASAGALVVIVAIGAVDVRASSHAARTGAAIEVEHVVFHSILRIGNN